MRLYWLAPAIATAVALLSPIPQPEPPPVYTTPPQLPAITVLSVGDSLTVGTDGGPTASYRGELSRLMTRTGQPHAWRVEAMGGSTCAHWADWLDTLITRHHPDVIFLNCGTNDTPESATEADYRRILATAQARGVQLVASTIGYPDMGSPTNAVRPWIDDWMHETNLAITRALADYPQVPVARMSRVPADPEWLQGDGVHLLPRAEAAYGQLFYQAVAPARGWRTLAQMRMVGMCGLKGAWTGDPRPRPDVDYRVCRN